jgi:hypothetical protein
MTSLRPDVTLWYENHALVLDWEPVDGADRYLIDAAGRTLTVAAADVTRPYPLPLETVAGTAYTVVVTVLGMPSEAREVTAVDLDPPVVTVRPVAAGVELDWAAVAAATGYDVEVADADGAVLRRSATGGAGLTLGPDEVLALDTPYLVRVRATAGAARGPWSAPVAVVLRSVRAILAALRDRLVAARITVPDGTGATPGLRYALDTVTLPDDLPEDAGGVRDALGAALDAVLGTPAAPATPVTVTTAADDPGPVLTDDRLVLAGTWTAFADDPTTATDLPVTIVFTVPESPLLRATWSATGLTGWTLGEVLPPLLGTPLDDLPLRGLDIVVDPDLSLRVTLGVRDDLHADDPYGPDVPRTDVTIGGPVTLTADAVSFGWTTAVDLTLGLARLGRPDLVIAGDEVALGCSADGSTYAAVRGRIDLDGDPVRVQASLPTPASPTVLVTAPAPELRRPDLAAALTAAGLADQVPVTLPATLLGLLDARVSGFAVAVDPSAGGTTRTVLTLATEAQWTPAPGLGLRAPSLTVSLLTTPGPEPYVSVQVTLAALVTLGVEVAVAATLRADGLWSVTVAGAPAVDAVAALAGLDGAGVLAVLPGALEPGAARLSSATVVVDPEEAGVRSVAVTVAQTLPWTLPGNALSLAGWTCELAFAAPAWTVRGQIRGDVTIGGAATFAVTLPVPLTAGVAELTLVEDEVVHLPTIGEVLGLLGDGPVRLPAGIATLGGLDLTVFALRVDVATGRVLDLAIAFGQTTTWTVIDGLLAVSDLDAAFAFTPSSDPVGVRGELSGVIQVAGHPVDVAAVKNDPAGSWTVYAADLTPIHLPSLAQLAGWFSPTASRAALPTALPLSKGIDLSALALRFGGAGGALDLVDFTVDVADVWTIVPGRWAFTDLRASLSVPQPVGAGPVSGTVAGVVTLAGVPIAVAGTKPPGGAAWVFTGELLAGLRVDLVTAATEISGTAVAVPADAVSRGLPAAIELRSAAVRLVPYYGTFHAEGELGFDWEFDFAGTHVAVRSLDVALDLASRDDPLVARLLGRLEVGGLAATVGLGFGTRDTPTVLTGSLAPADLATVAVPALADELGTGTTTWADVVPAALAPPVFADADVLLDVSGERFLLHGAVSVAGQTQLDGLLYVARTGEDWTYAVAVALGADFRMGALVPALAVVDDVVRVTDARLVICDLGDGTLGALATDTAAALALADPSATPPLAGLAADALALSAGAYLTARFDFDPVTLFGRLLEIGPRDGLATVRIAALIDAADPLNTVCTADLPDLTLLTAITLTGTHLSYRPALAHRFELDGQIAFPALFDARPVFDVTLSVDDTGLTSSVTQTAQEIDRPFGIPGVVLSGLGADVRVVWAVPATGSTPAVPGRSWVALRGHVLLGPAPAPDRTDQRPSVGARLALLDGRPVLFDLALDRDFSVGAFLAQCITGSGSDWPGDFVELTFLSGSRISYYDATADPAGALAVVDGHRFPAGFTVDAQIRLTLVTSVTLHGIVTADAGFTAVTGAAFVLDDPLDLGFVQLAGTSRTGDGPYEAGPTLGFATGATPVFALSTGVNFLGAAFGTVGVSVRSGSDGGSRYTGTLTAAEPLEPFGRLSAAFTYTTHPSRDGELEIADWPSFDWARQLIDFVAELRRIIGAAGGPCGALAQSATAAACRPSFTLDPSVDATGGNLIFGLQGTYALTFGDWDSPFVTQSLPAMRITVPMTTTWDELPEVLAAGIAAGAGDVVLALLTHPVDTVIFLVMVFGPLAAEVALEMLCNGLIDGLVAFATEAAAAFLASALGAAAAALGAAVLLPALIAAIIAALASGDDDDSGDPQDTTPRRPVVTSLAYDTATDAFTVAWGGSKYASAYTVEILGPDGTTLVSQDVGRTLGGTFPVPLASLGAGTYQARVRGRRGSATGEWGTLTADRLPAPATGLAWGDDVLVGSWLPVAGATGYRVRLVAGDGTPLVDTTVAAGAPSGDNAGPTPPPGSMWVSVPVPDPVAGSYTAQVTAVGPGTALPSMPPVPAVLELLTLTAPELTAFSVDGEGQLSVFWRAVAGVEHYEIELHEHGTDPQRRDADGRVTSCSLLPTGTAPAPGTVFEAAVRAVGQGSAGPWTRATLNTAEVAAPAGLEATVFAGAIGATWTPLAGAAAYEVRLTQLSDGPDVVVGTVAAADPAGTPVPRADGVPPAVGDRYAVQVRAAAGDPVGRTVGPWSERAEVTVEPPPDAPAGVGLAFSGGAFAVGWTAGPAGLTYDVEISFTRTDTVVATATGLTGTAATLHRTDAAALVPGDRYDARVRAVRVGTRSDWSEWASAAYLDVPSITAAVYSAGGVQLKWTPTAAPAGGYQVSLVRDGTTIGQDLPPVDGVSPAPGTRVDVSGQPGYTVWTATVRAWMFNQFRGDRSAPVAVTVADPPAGLTLGWDGSRITASWTAARGATSYDLQLLTAAGAVLASSTVTASPVTFAPGPLAAGVRYDCALVARGPDVTSATVRASLTPLAGPAGLTAGDDPSNAVATWTAVPGATGYDVQITDLAGRAVVGTTTSTPSVSIDRSALTPGVDYLLKVRARAEQPGPWSAPVAVPQGTYDVWCLGTTPGGSCTVTPGAYGAFQGKAYRSELDALYAVSRTPARSGWVAARHGDFSGLSVLGLLVVALRANGVLSEADATGVFADAPAGGYLGKDGLLAMCLGTPPGESCRRPGPAGGFGATAAGVAPGDFARTFHPGVVSGATGWVAIDPATSGLAVLLRLAGTLAAKGKLTGDQPWRVFTDSLAVSVGSGSGGDACCVRIGSPVGTATGPGAKVGDVMVGVSDAERAGPYAPADGWAALPAGEASVYQSILMLVLTLIYDDVLTGPEAFALFDQAAGLA